MKIEIYTDGACRFNGSDKNIGAWAYLIIIRSGTELVKFQNSGYELKTTNNIMELTAIYKSIQSIDISKLIESDLVIYSDSSYSINSLTVWYDKWELNNWKKSDGSEISNLGIIKEIHLLLEKSKSYKFIKVKGHSGDSYNDTVDYLCNKSMDDYLFKLSKNINKN